MVQKSVKTHANIISLWPSFQAFVDDIGAPYLAIHKWQSRDSIPAKYWTRVVACAHDRDLPVTYKLLAECCAVQASELIQNLDKVITPE